MDEDRIHGVDGGLVESSENPTGDDAVGASAGPTVSPEPGWAGGDRTVSGRRGWAPYGWWSCVVGMGVLVLLLVVGYRSIRQTVWMGYRAASQRILDNLPPRLPGGELHRTHTNLERWQTHLDELGDPYGEIGAFVALTRDLFEDRMLTFEEVGRVNGFVEERLGPPPGEVAQ